MLVATYSRVSSQRQEQEQTIETQIFAIKEYAKSNNLAIVKEYKDEGWSGTILARPSLDELRLDVKKKLWEAVVIYDPDRVARKYSYQSLIIDELEEAGIKVLFVTTPRPKDDSDRLLYGVKGLFAEYERARIADRFRLGKLRKAREGNIVTTEAPYGYDYVLKQGNKDGYLQINKKEALVVKMIFSWIGEKGFTIREVVRQFQELGIPPRKSKRGVWNTSTLVNLLRNETYIGNAHYHKSYAVVPEKPLKEEKYKKIKKTSRKMRDRSEWISIPTPKIIEKELFERTQAQLKTNFELSKRNRKNDYLLAGKIYCICGRRRAGEGAQRGKHLYYRCTDRVHNFPLPPSCKEKGVNARIADKIACKELATFLTSSDLIKRQVDRWISKEKKGKGVENQSVEIIEEELERIKSEEQRYVKAYGAQLINFEQLQGFVGDLKIKRASLEGQLKKTVEQKEEVNIPNSQQIDRFVVKARENLFNFLGLEEKFEFEKGQAFVRRFVDKVVASQKEMMIYGYLPLRKENEYVEFWSIGRDNWIT